MSDTNEDFKKIILAEAKKGNVVIRTPEGLAVFELAAFIKQPTLGLLYDLNRDSATVLTFINDPKWVNDFAVCQVITALKNKIEELEKEVKMKTCKTFKT